MYCFYGTVEAPLEYSYYDAIELSMYVCNMRLKWPQDIAELRVKHCESMSMVG